MRMRVIKISLLVIGILLLQLSVTGQRIYTKSASISFFSKAPLETITAVNNQVMAVLHPQTGEMQFSVIIKSFQFKKALMEEHFNENYLESHKYPKASFKGKITDMNKLNFAKDGTYAVTVMGDLTIHGVTKSVTVPGTISIKNGMASSSSKFNLKLADYNISIPRLVKDNIAETVELTVNCVYDKKL